MVVMPKSMVCKRCASGAKGKVAKTQLTENVRSRATLHGAAILYSFIAFAVLSIFSAVVGDGGSTLLVAAILGVVVVEKLNQVKVSLSRSAKLPLIIIGIIFGGALGFGVRALIGGDVSVLLSISFGIGLLVTIAAVFFRLRST